MTDPKYWLTPPEMYAELDDQYHFDCDPCPNPLPEGFDGLRAPWGRMSYVNPPFRPADVENTTVKRPGPTAFARKAIEEYHQGRGSFLVLPLQNYALLLVEAGAEMVSMGRVRWREVETGEPMPGPSPIMGFHLPPGMKKDE